jgi:hypothetical protein
MALASGCTAAVLVYAVLRAGQVLVGGEANPATVIVRSQHFAYLWRAWTSAFAGALAALSAYVVSDRHAPRLARALVVALPIVVGVLILQAIFLP